MLARIRDENANSATVVKRCNPLVQRKEAHGTKICPESEQIIHEWKMLEKTITRMAVGILESARAKKLKDMSRLWTKKMIWHALKSS